MTKKMVLLRQLLAILETKLAKQQQGCFKCEGPHLQKNCQKRGKQQSVLAKTTQMRNGDLAQVFELACDWITERKKSQSTRRYRSRCTRRFDFDKEKAKRQEANPTKKTIGWYSLGQTGWKQSTDLPASTATLNFNTFGIITLNARLLSSIKLNIIMVTIQRKLP